MIYLCTGPDAAQWDPIFMTPTGDGPVDHPPNSLRASSSLPARQRGTASIRADRWRSPAYVNQLRPAGLAAPRSACLPDRPIGPADRDSRRPPSHIDGRPRVPLTKVVPLTWVHPRTKIALRAGVGLRTKGVQLPDIPRSTKILLISFGDQPVSSLIYPDICGKNKT
jgi:hypothetical protein